MRKIAIALAFAAGCAGEALPNETAATVNAGTKGPMIYVVSATCNVSCPWIESAPSDVYTTSDPDAARGRFVVDGDAYAATEPSIAEEFRNRIRYQIDKWQPGEDLEMTRGASDGTWVHLIIHSAPASK